MKKHEYIRAAYLYKLKVMRCFVGIDGNRMNCWNPKTGYKSRGFKLVKQNSRRTENQ